MESELSELQGKNVMTEEEAAQMVHILVIPRLRPRKEASIKIAADCCARNTSMVLVITAPVWCNPSHLIMGKIPSALMVLSLEMALNPQISF